MTDIFNNTETAFKAKSFKHLKRSRFLFWLIDKAWIVKIGKSLLNISLCLRVTPGIFVRPAFNHFCGGDSLEKSKHAVDQLKRHNIKAILDYSVEGRETKADFEHVTNETLSSIKYAAKNNNIAFAVFKPTALTYNSLLKNISLNKKLSAPDLTEKKLFLNRIDMLCKSAHAYNIPILIDAEDYNFQGAIDEVAELMMKKYNSKKAIVFHTLQMYRKDRMKYLYKLNENAIKENFFLGIKFVRGAYMEKERILAKEAGYPDPIHENKHSTDKNFNQGLEFAASKMDKISIFNGTHNEESCLLLVHLMKKYNIAKSDNRVYFAQLYGMSDHISFNLADMGYNVAKYVPYGPIKYVMPYLMRRAEENTSVKGQTNRELSLITKEIKRRKNNRYDI